jgi:hypothetical protein
LQSKYKLSVKISLTPIVSYEINPILVKSKKGV